MSDEPKFPPDVEIALEVATWQYIHDVKDIMCRCSRDELAQIAGDFDVEGSAERSLRMFDDYARRSAFMELIYRDVDTRAAPIMNLEGSSGAYCVEHDCDARKCGEKHVE